MRNQKKSAGTWLRQALSVVVSVALLAYVLAQADFAKLMETLRAVKAQDLILASALLVLCLLYTSQFIILLDFPVLRHFTRTAFRARYIALCD